MTGDVIYIDGRPVPCIGEIATLTRRGSHAGSLSFSALFRVAVGSKVEFHHGGEGVFAGVVFSVKSVSGLWECVAYDSLRYLAGRDAYSLVGVTASAVVRAAASIYGLSCGHIAETGYKIDTIIDEASALAVIEGALAMTADAGFGEYLLLDDFGSLSLLPLSETAPDRVISSADAMSFSVTESVGDDHYNYVTVVRYVDNVRQIFVAEDKEDIARFGRLPYLRRLRTAEIGQLAADAALSAHLGVSVNIDCVLPFYDRELRGGGAVHALVDGEVRNMYCESCRCRFGESSVMTELSLRSV